MESLRFLRGWKVEGFGEGGKSRVLQRVKSREFLQRVESRRFCRECKVESFAEGGKLRVLGGGQVEGFGKWHVYGVGRVWGGGKARVLGGDKYGFSSVVDLSVVRTESGPTF